MFKAMPWARMLPAYKLASSVPDRYRIRLEPNDEPMSTVEAIVLALRALEPERQLARRCAVSPAMFDEALLPWSNGVAQTSTSPSHRQRVRFGRRRFNRIAADIREGCPLRLGSNPHFTLRARRRRH
jgi:hypothetical protein